MDQREYARRHQPFYLRQTQPWAVEQESMRHAQALMQVGEPVVFVLMWKVEDYEAGLVDRCPRCRQDTDTLTGRIQAVYKQPLTALCGYCFGTTFHGGIRARIVRPAVVTDADEDERKGGRGVTHSESVSVQATNDFRSRTGDFMFRHDGSRWQLSLPQRVMLRTGFEAPTQYGDSTGYATIPARREDASSVAFQIPPPREELPALLASPGWWPAGRRGQDPNTPYFSSTHDVINGPLIPSYPASEEIE